MRWRTTFALFSFPYECSISLTLTRCVIKEFLVCNWKFLRCIRDTHTEILGLLSSSMWTQYSNCSVKIKLINMHSIFIFDSLVQDRRWKRNADTASTIWRTSFFSSSHLSICLYKCLRADLVQDYIIVNILNLYKIVSGRNCLKHLKKWHYSAFYSDQWIMDI